MNKIQMAVLLFTTGIIGHLIMRKSMDIGNAIRALFNNQRGEGEAGGEIKFTAEQQAHIDKIINTRVGEIKSKYEPIVKEAEELKKFKGEFEKNKEQQTLAEQEKAKQYDEAKKTYETKITDFSQKLSAKDQEIANLRVEHALTNEISKQGGFTEEVLAMVKTQAKLNAAGQVVIPSKDANGVDVELPVEAGIKKFLTERPHLVKASFKPGGGSGSGQGSGGQGAGGAGEEILDSLNAKYAEACKGTDLKLRSELKGKINAMLVAKKVNR